ncbi:MAG TPA: ABC transporter permease [Acidobacteriota bacterium]|nr:ABC transporter permease [Acidobacteriota bacterium]
MQFDDVVRLTIGTIRAHRLRTILTMLGIAIGTASVILLTSIGEGLRTFVLTQFTQFGTNLMAIHPGKSETFGLPGIASSTRNLTLEDAERLMRIPGIEKVVPVSFGSGRVEYKGRGRSVFVYGVTSDVLEVWKFRIRQGLFLPPGDPRRGPPVVVIGPSLKRELFSDENALGKYVDIGGRRFQVIGIMESKGQMLGIDIDDSAYIPVSIAMKLFNKEGLNEIDLTYSTNTPVDLLTKRVKEVLKEQHDDEEDFTIITQTEMLQTLGNVLNILTMAVGSIAGISLLVGAVGILTMMWISVNERISEIGLQKAIGAEPGQLLTLFLAEAAVLSTTGGTIGVIAGLSIALILGFFIPALPIRVPTLYVVLSVIVSIIVGLLSGVLPARRAAKLDPLEALRTE